VVSEACAKAIDAQVGTELLSAATPADYVGQITRLLGDSKFARTIGQAGRQRVLRSYTWEAHLSDIDRRLAELCSAGASA
jgi:spore maturation protein CgeB